MRRTFLVVVCAISALLTTIDKANSAELYETAGEIERLDPTLDKLISADAKIEVLADGFQWSEGPIWVSDESLPSGGYLIFSSVPENVIYRWDEQRGLSVFLKPAGYTGKAPRGGETGSNGLTFDSQGRLTLCQHGDRRIARLTSKLGKNPPQYETVADRYQTKRFNAPNDLVYHSSGDLVFTDPAYGMEHGWDDPKRELDFQGVYRVAPGGKATLLTDRLYAPNGVAFSPDEKILYVAQSHAPEPFIMAYRWQGDGTIDEGRVFFDASELAKQRPGMPDGLKVDEHGNLFCTGPGGVLVIHKNGKHLGTILTGELTSNCAFGDDGRTLYMTCNKKLCRVRLKTTGSRFKEPSS